MTKTATATMDPPAPAAGDFNPDAYPRHTHADRFPRLDNIRLSQIDRSRNHRIARPGDEERIADLMRSIEASGQLQPVRVYEVQPPAEGKRRVDPDNPGAPLYILGFGWRRCEALARLNYNLVRAEIYPPAPDHEIEAARAIENIARQDITPIEEAQAVADIVTAYRKDHPEATHLEALHHAAAETGRSETWVRDRDYFARLCEPVRDLAMRCSLPAGHLREIAKLGDPALQIEVALFAVKGNSYWFKPGTLTPKGDSWAKKNCQDFFEEIDGGKINREPIQRVKQRVEEQQRSLKSVPWQLTLPVLVAGQGALPACDTCEHNTANDITLFGVDDGKGSAHCMNPGCFAQKTSAAETERGKAAKWATRKAKQDDATKATQAVERAPGWLDPKKLTGFVKREQQKAKASPAAAGKGERESVSGRHGARKLTAHEMALKKYRKAVEVWYSSAGDLMSQLVHASTIRTAAWRLLSLTEALEEVDRVELVVPDVREYGPPQVKSPTPAGDLTEDILGALELAGSKDAVAVVELAAFPAQRYAESRPLDCLPEHPEFIGLLVRAFGGDVAVLGAFPDWSNFAPAQDKPEKVAANKKLTKQKTSKKKAAVAA